MVAWNVPEKVVIDLCVEGLGPVAFRAFLRVGAEKQQWTFDHGGCLEAEITTNAMVTARSSIASRASSQEPSQSLTKRKSMMSMEDLFRFDLLLGFVGFCGSLLDYFWNMLTQTDFVLQNLTKRGVATDWHVDLSSAWQGFPLLFACPWSRSSTFARKFKCHKAESVQSSKMAIGLIKSKHKICT